jgi:S1-C subfamily serine protease
MRSLLALSVLLILSSCDSPTPTPAPAPLSAPTAEITEKSDITTSVLRVNSTQQTWSAGQPWEKNSPTTRHALAAIVGPAQVLTTAELVADSTFLEFETPDGNHLAQAKVIAVDYEANLALLGPVTAAEGDLLFEKTTPLTIAQAPKIGDSIEILQIEDNGRELITAGSVRSIDVTSNFLPGHEFLTYFIKASMQSAASSYSLPVLSSGALSGILTNYDNDDQLCQVIPVDIIQHFLKASSTLPYAGFPSLGVSISRTEDPSFREWLKLSPDTGGLYINQVRKDSPAAQAGVKVGDVLLAVDGHTIDRRGYYDHPTYGRLFWGHLVRGSKSTGDILALELLRDGQALSVTATLTREDVDTQLIPSYDFDQAPSYLVKGGFIFQELSRPLLESFGENWRSRAPLNFLDALENPEKYEETADRIIFLSASIPTPATVGYESLRNLIVRKVNGQNIKNMKSLITAFATHTAPLHTIEFDEQKFTIYLDQAVSATVDAQLLKRGIAPLSRAD